MHAVQEVRGGQVGVAAALHLAAVERHLPHVAVHESPAYDALAAEAQDTGRVAAAVVPPREGNGRGRGGGKVPEREDVGADHLGIRRAREASPVVTEGAPNAPLLEPHIVRYHGIGAEIATPIAYVAAEQITEIDHDTVGHPRKALIAYVLHIAVAPKVAAVIAVAIGCERRREDRPLGVSASSLLSLGANSMGMAAASEAAGYRCCRCGGSAAPRSRGARSPSFFFKIHSLHHSVATTCGAVTQLTFPTSVPAKLVGAESITGTVGQWCVLASMGTGAARAEGGARARARRASVAIRILASMGSRGSATVSA